MVVLCRISDMPGTVTKLGSQTFFRDNPDRDPEEDINDSDSDSDSSVDIDILGFDSE